MIEVINYIDMIEVINYIDMIEVINYIDMIEVNINNFGLIKAYILMYANFIKL